MLFNGRALGVESQNPYNSLHFIILLDFKAALSIQLYVFVNADGGQACQLRHVHVHVELIYDE